MAAEQDAARDRVLAARSEFDASIGDLGASARYAVDIRRRSAGARPRRPRSSAESCSRCCAGRSGCGGRSGGMSCVATRHCRSGCSLKEIEKAIDRMGDDGDKVRGTIERDFADYVKQRQRERRAIPTAILLSAARPIIGAAARRAMEYLTAPPSAGCGTASRGGPVEGRRDGRGRPSHRGRTTGGCAGLGGTGREFRGEHGQGAGGHGAGRREPPTGRLRHRRRQR